MDELIEQGLKLIEQFGAIAVLFMWLVWLIRQNEALKNDHKAQVVALKLEQEKEIARLRQERDKSNQDYIDLLTEIKVNRPVRELRYDGDDRPTRPLRSGLTDQERQRLIEAQDEEIRRRGDISGFGTD